MDPSSLANTKVVRQQKVTEAIMKDIMQRLKRYIAVHDNNELVPCNNAELFDEF